jgi:AAA15 family ATPase/GTPase
MNSTLPQLDTGIARIGGEEIPFDNLPIPAPMKSQLMEEVKEGMIVRLLAEPMDERFLVARKDGSLIAKKLIAYHSMADGSEIKFDMRQESDGSRRAIDILPAFLNLASDGSKKVYVIDEVERSLHTLLTRKMIETFLDNCTAESRMQLLLTTHDVFLMDQKIMRRDEMWVAERDDLGASSLTSFSEYLDIRYDKDIRKSYMQGRLGGIPQIMLGSSLPAPRLSDGKG